MSTLVGREGIDYVSIDLPPQARKTRSNPSLFQDGSQTNVISTVSNVDQDQPQ